MKPRMEYWKVAPGGFKALSSLEAYLRHSGLDNVLLHMIIVDLPAAVTPGYAGGTRETADYETVSTGRTKHAEAIRITYDPARLTYGQLLKVFFSVAHDPTQRNRQGNDIGPQYRSALFPQDADQRRVAEAYIKQLNDAGAFTGPIATTIEPDVEFYEAETYHHDYAKRNPTSGYIMAVSMPKVRKLEKYFPEKLKKG